MRSSFAPTQSYLGSGKYIPLFTTRLLYAYSDEARRDPKAYLCLGFLTLLNAPFHKSFLFLWQLRILLLEILFQERVNLLSIVQRSLDFIVTFFWMENSVYSRDSRYDSRTGTLLLINIQLNLYIQHLAFQQILYDMRTSVSSQHLYQQLRQSERRASELAEVSRACRLLLSPEENRRRGSSHYGMQEQKRKSQYCKRRVSSSKLS